jgi:hypothetical protein
MNKKFCLSFGVCFNKQSLILCEEHTLQIRRKESVMNKIYISVWIPYRMEHKEKFYFS